MKAVLRYFLFAFFAFLVPAFVLPANTCFRGGPYLQELVPDGVTVVFENTLPTFSWVELRRKGQTSVTRFYQDVEGQHQAYDYIQAPSAALPVQNFAIRLSGLSSDTMYEYRVVSQKIDQMKPYSLTSSTQYESDWFGFCTPSDKAATHRLLVLSDLHNRPSTLAKFLTALDCKTADHIIYAGDMMDNMQMKSASGSAFEAEEPYASFINVSTQLFATQKDFCMLRGDHETKGDAAVGVIWRLSCWTAVRLCQTTTRRLVLPDWRLITHIGRRRPDGWNSLFRLPNIKRRHTVSW